MKIPFLVGCICLFWIPAYSQKDFAGYKQLYPVTDDPFICYKTSYVKQETILFEAVPTIRYSFSNNIIKGLLNDSNHVRAWYVSVRPHLRMYTDNSLPVKTPSYRVLFGTQHMWRLKKDNFLAFSLESGHYSNGQSGSAFSEAFDDGTPQSDSIYNLLTPSSNLSDLLNRKSGNYSTNLTELILNYRINRLDDNNIPDRVHSLRAGLILYHDRFIGLADFGGYSDHDIRIYGRFRFLAGYEYIHTLSKCGRYSLAGNLEWIGGAHEHVTPGRLELRSTWYPFSEMQDFGFFIGFSSGHDNYNFRFVDSGNQFTAGITWSMFPPFMVKSGK